MPSESNTIPGSQTSLAVHNTTPREREKSDRVYVAACTTDERIAELFDDFTAQTPEFPFVIAQLGQSLDGRIATVTGDSKYINRHAALDHLHRIRSRVDAVVVGVGTVVADDPLLTVRRVEGRNPARVVIDPSGRMPRDAACLVDDGTERLVISTPDAPAIEGVETLTLARGPHGLDPREILRLLRKRGYKRILVEGGSRTISTFIDAGCIDRLHVLVAPLLIGSGKPGLELAPIATLSQALRPRSQAYLLADGDVLFDCDLRRTNDEGGGP
jgi:diaminohydroxyphosphoribosylaminopyrimidine deaminase/5-amino-6-(5-phosphoribosylamino)uracil reductase